MVHPSLPHQRPRSEENGHHVREGDRRHPAAAPRRLEEKSISDGKRWTPQLRKDWSGQKWALTLGLSERWAVTSGAWVSSTLTAFIRCDYRALLLRNTWWLKHRSRSPMITGCVDKWPACHLSNHLKHIFSWLEIWCFFKQFSHHCSGKKTSCKKDFFFWVPLLQSKNLI